MRNTASAITITLALVAGTVFLTWQGKDITPLIVIATALVGGLIHGKVDQVQNSVNGNLTNLHNLVNTLSQQLGSSIPASIVQTATLTQAVPVESEVESGPSEETVNSA